MGKFRKIIEEKNITANSLWDYSQELVQAGKEGWETNAANRFFPFTNLNLYVIGLVKYEPEVEKEVVQDAAVEAVLAKVAERTGEEQAGAAIAAVEAESKPRRGPKPKAQ